MKANTVMIGRPSAGKSRLFVELIQDFLRSDRIIAVENCAELHIPRNPFYYAWNAHPGSKDSKDE